MSAVGIVAALAAEVRALGAVGSQFAEPVILPGGARLAANGIGLDAAARAAAALIDAGCDALASCGLAGGLDPTLAAGTIVIPQALIRAGGPEISTSPAWGERIGRSLAARWPIAGGTLLSSTSAVRTRAEKSHAFRATGAAAVDMESYAVGEVARERHVPFLTVRVIVDAATDELPSGVIRATDPHGTVSMVRLLQALVRDPAMLGPLVRLARRYHLARRALRAVATSGALLLGESEPVSAHRDA